MQEWEKYENCGCVLKDKMCGMYLSTECVDREAGSQGPEAKDRGVPSPAGLILALLNTRGSQLSLAKWECHAWMDSEWINTYAEEGAIHTRQLVQIKRATGDSHAQAGGWGLSNPPQPPSP